MSRPAVKAISRCCAVVLALVSSGGCWSSSGPQVVAYTAQDEEFSQPIFEEFRKQTGIRVLPKFDTESTKTVGLAEAIVAERARPRADVFWNNEILHTLRLEKLGLLEAYRPRGADDFPASYRSPRGTWHGFAARARVLLVNTNLVGERERPASLDDLVDPKWRRRVGMAKPLFGTTATHAACLFAAWGDEKARAFYRQLKKNARVLSGNRQVAQAVASGQLAFGITDTDDAMVEVEQGSPVAIVYPDQQPGGLGTLFIPNTLAIVKGCPHPAEARRLVDFLLSPAVEEELAAGPSAQIPLNPRAKRAARVETPQTVHAMDVDFSKAGEKWDEVAKFLRDEFTSPR
jgi:iron(III) transport system substrate-binding protein